MDGSIILLIVAAACLFSAVLVLVLGIGNFAEQKSVLDRRLSGRSAPATGGAGAGVILEDNVLGEFRRFVTPKDMRDLNSVRQRLIKAGYRRPSAVRVFYVARAALGLGFGVLSALLVPLLAGSFPLPILLLIVLVLILIGFLAPSLWVERQAQYRQKAVEEGFPDALDMLLVCIEAGQGLDIALRRMSRELVGTNKTLAEEFTIVSDELRAGKERGLVLRDFADRANVTDVSAFVTVLRQSDEFGVSIADALRVYAAEMRNKRIMRAEEKANTIPVKLALGSILFTVPPIALIMSGPSFIMIIRSFAGMGTH